MYLGLDFGTSSVKGVIINDKQKPLATISSPLKVSRPHPGWSEQNPEDWWKAATSVIKALRKAKPKAVAQIKGIGLSGQQHGATLLDKSGQVLRPCILWNDTRSFAECSDILHSCPEAKAITGNIPLAGFTAPKLLWVKKHEPEVFAQVAKVLLPKDYIRWRMIGTYASDMSDSAGTYWLDVARRDWSDVMLQATAMRRDQMPELFEGTDATGRLSDKLAREWGMNLKPVVAGGGGDNASAAVGLGAVHDGDAILSLGTSGVMFVCNASFNPNTARAVHTFCHAVPGVWHQMGVILSATDSIEWLARLLKTPAAKLTSALGKRLKNPSPVLLLPYFSGERTPVADAQIRAAFLGLAQETDAKELTHAVLDAVAFAFRESLDALRQGGASVKRLTAVGGGTKSEIWLKIIATALQIPIDIPASGEMGGAFGAARMGLMAATGIPYASVCTKPKIVHTILPENAAISAYETAYRRYTKIYSAIKDI